MSKPQKDYEVTIPNEIIKDLLTESELRMVKQRILVMQLLTGGLSVRAIAEKVGVGTDTVVRVSKMMRKLNLDKLLSEPIEKNTSKYVFGKSDI